MIHTDGSTCPSYSLIVCSSDVSKGDLIFVEWDRYDLAGKISWKYSMLTKKGPVVLCPAAVVKVGQEFRYSNVERYFNICLVVSDTVVWLRSNDTLMYKLNS